MATGSVDLGATTGGVPPSGAAGGDLSGSYPNPSVASVGGSSAADIHTSQLLTAAATSAATALTLCLRDSNGNANFSALNMVHTVGGNNNVGMGTTASSGESVALYIHRTADADTLIQIDNDNNTSNATAGIQFLVNGASMGVVHKAFTASNALADLAGRGGVYTFGMNGYTVSGGAGDVWISAGGHALANVVCKFNADNSMTSNGGIIIATTASRPTAGAAYRGMLWVTQGAGGVADKISVCLKSAADTYSWKDIISG